ncbi:MAG: Phosphoenolpyruvate-dependent sugar phosphotransferase system, EIIA 2 [Lentisphaerae bacterium ADurb.Bin242]|nr:MAG: Phosphoenolpyruvate-dependent sugar phosphotransferase system, EIIA 2 [Lentisphaerae bacterium ADurb.Bin242]
MVSGKSDLKRLIETARPSCPLTVLEGETWTEVQTMFLNDISENDMVMMPMERHTGIFWTPALEKLQETVFSRFPGINLVSAYPSLHWQSEEAPPALQPPASVKPDIFSADIPAGAEGEAGLETMVRKAFGEDRKVFADVVPGLVRSMNAYPLELSKDIVLIHAHCKSVFTPAIILGRSEREWRFRNLKGSYRILTVLISPKSAPTEQHLKALADLARTFLDPKLSRKVCSAASAEEIEKLFRSLY